ncbi:hypothetical protein TNCV_2962291 [Trichonephila clavipes]|nr:hypothetical protein TNCV_2962291 [Trichonephila clavipes]
MAGMIARFHTIEKCFLWSNIKEIVSLDVVATQKTDLVSLLHHTCTSVDTSLLRHVHSPIPRRAQAYPIHDKEGYLRQSCFNIFLSSSLYSHLILFPTTIAGRSKLPDKEKKKKRKRFLICDNNREMSGQEPLVSPIGGLPSPIGKADTDDGFMFTREEEITFNDFRGFCFSF